MLRRNTSEFSLGSFIHVHIYQIFSESLLCVSNSSSKDTALKKKKVKMSNSEVPRTVSSVTTEKSKYSMCEILRRMARKTSQKVTWYWSRALESANSIWGNSFPGWGNKKYKDQKKRKKYKDALEEACSKSKEAHSDRYPGGKGTGSSKGGWRGSMSSGKDSGLTGKLVWSMLSTGKMGIGLDFKSHTLAAILRKTVGTGRQAGGLLQ